MKLALSICIQSKFTVLPSLSGWNAVYKAVF